MEFLQALATVCESAPRLALSSSGHQYPEARELSSVPLPRPQTLHSASAAASTLSHSMFPPRTPRLPGPYQTPGGAAPHFLHVGYGHCLPPVRPQPLQSVMTPTTRDYAASTMPPLPTPPPTPADRTLFRHPYVPHYTQLPSHSNGYSYLPLPQQPTYPAMLPTPSPSPSPSPALTSTEGLENTVSHMLYESYLNETWPEQGIRRGGSVIRDSLYQQVVAVLQGEEANARLKQWIKRSEFFLKKRDGCRSVLAVPATRSRGGKRSGADTVGGKSETRGPHKLVARLEDFPCIISSYHNSERGHHGIRKTYAMVSHTTVQVYVYNMDSACITISNAFM